MNSAQPFVTDFYFGIVIEKFFPILRPVRYDEIGDFCPTTRTKLMSNSESFWINYQIPLAFAFANFQTSAEKNLG